MELMEAIRTRRSVRSYLDREVEDDKLSRVLEAARLAPSASNRQNWRFVVVKDSSTRRKLSVAARGQAFVAEAPVVIAACGTDMNYIMTCGQAAYTVDVTIAVDHMTLAAASEGLGTCWIGAFYEDQVKEILGIPRDVRVVALLPLGYPAKVPQPTPRKSPGEIVALERW
ncbi:MAG TPA: nitroreductase family protein [Methanotrichaceae archaeon]|nr:nitroreductase family protein [Methanotrichaceae archaeon]